MESMPNQFDKKIVSESKSSSLAEKLEKEYFGEQSLNEKSTSKSQQKFMGMVHAAQKGEKDASPKVAKVAKSMKKGDATDFAKTKHKGLPDHVAESRHHIHDNHGTFDHILQRFPAEVKQFERGEELNDHLYEALHDYYFSIGEIPYAVAKSREGSPFEWVENKFREDLGNGEGNDLLDSPVDTELGNPELDEISRLAGLHTPEVDEDGGYHVDTISPLGHGGEIDEASNNTICPTCNGSGEGMYDGSICPSCHGTGEDDSHKHDDFAPTDSTDLDIHESITDESEQTRKHRDATSSLDRMMQNAKDNTKYVPRRPDAPKDTAQDEKEVAVNEDVNLNISATGEDDALNLIRKLSGLQTTEQPCSCQQGNEYGGADEEDPFGQELQTTDDEYADDSADGVEILEVPMEEERDIEYVNTPREKVAPLSAAYPSGSDMNRAKKSYSDQAYHGDNAMAESKEDVLWQKYSDMLEGVKK